MQKLWFIALTLGMLSLLSGSAVINSRAETANTKGDYLRGDYVETRTASVFAGACHYNGELTTTGRDALMAWNVAAGRWKGVELAGVRAVAIVSADSNLADNGSDRRSEIIINREASHAQAVALVDALKTKYQTALGRVVSVSSAPVKFEHEAKAYYVSTTNLASMSVEAMPNDLCCKMPNLVWYAPLVTLESRKVGFTKKAIYAGDAVGEPWQRTEENSAFYGSFSF